ncbi:MAG: helix-turn-helix transcriptional regulator [Rhodospirillales bacterium]|jgi:transcriptional regulator with XRE-family HTH domain|nr:helix-turn-helix transcriptional regulator [Rhodospirillales bacterium]
MGRYDAIDVPVAGEGEAFAGDLPRVADGSRTQPGWMALSELALRDETVRSASGAAKAGAFVRTMRLAAGLSQDQLASASGMTQSMVSDLERGAGKIGPSFETLLRLAEACGMDIGFVPVGMGAAETSVHKAQGAADAVMTAALDRINDEFVAAAQHFKFSSPAGLKPANLGQGGFAPATVMRGQGKDGLHGVVVGKATLGRTTIEVSSEGLLRVREGGGRDVVYGPISVQMPEVK